MVGIGITVTLLLQLVVVPLAASITWNQKGGREALSDGASGYLAGEGPEKGSGVCNWHYTWSPLEG